MPTQGHENDNVRVDFRTRQKMKAREPPDSIRDFQDTIEKFEGDIFRGTRNL
jgi:hypothetical protein